MLQDPLFTALTRPQLFLGVPYSFAIINLIITTELFLIFTSFWALIAALAIHAAGWLMTLADPHMITLWLTKVRHCTRIPNHKLWGCNSYRP